MEAFLYLLIGLATERFEGYEKQRHYAWYIVGARIAFDTT